MSSLQDFDYLRIPLAEIKSVTNNFADEQIIGRGGFGNVYKGQLFHCGQLIDIAIKRLDYRMEQLTTEFWTEIWMLSNLKHENLVSIVGFCDEDGEKIIINEYAVHGSLDKYLSDQTLTWMQRLKIFVGAARALSYIHYDARRSYGVIHRDIKSSNVLLQENWEAKVCDFGHSIKILAARRHRLVLEHSAGTPGYADPIYIETGSVTQKSDVYSFGVVMFEVLCGRKLAMVVKVGGGYEILAPNAKHQYEEGKLDEMIDPNLRDQMDPQSMTIFSETAYHCLNRQRTHRPDMEKVVKRLEKALELQQKHENPVRRYIISFYFYFSSKSLYDH